MAVRGTMVTMEYVFCFFGGSPDIARHIYIYILYMYIYIYIAPASWSIDIF